MNNVKFPFSVDAVFCKVLEENPDIAKKIMFLAAGEELQGIDMDSITVQKQKPFDPSMENKSIRLDVYMKGDGFFGDVEMQTTPDEFALRTRYYLSVHDTDNLPKGSRYKELPKAIIVFICTFDPFNLGYAKYVAKEKLFAGEGWSEDVTNKAKYDAEYVKIYLTTEKVEHENVSPELSKFLEYVRNQKPTDQFTNELEEKVEEVNRKDWKYIMTLQDRIILSEEKGRNEKAISIALKMLQKGNSVKDIAEITELPVSEVEKLRLSNLEK